MGTLGWPLGRSLGRSADIDLDKTHPIRPLVVLRRHIDRVDLRDGDEDLQKHEANLELGDDALLDAPLKEHAKSPVPFLDALAL